MLKNLNINYFIELLNHNLFIFLFFKIFLILFFIILFIFGKGPIKKIFTLILLLTIIVIMLTYNKVIIVLSSFFFIMFIYIAVSMYMYFKVNETKFLLINKFKQNQNTFNQLKYVNNFSNNIKEKAKEINKGKYTNNNAVINNEILSLYSDASKAKYKYKLFASITSFYKKSMFFIIIYIQKYKLIFNLILIDIKLILVIIAILNFYNIINTIYTIRFMQFFFQFN